MPGSKFEEILRALTEWGEVLFIVHTPDIVLECAGTMPPGSFGRGYFNLHGDSPIGGHIKAENCAHIAFVSRPFMGRPSRSLQFFNGAGEAMFKIFVRRDKERNLIARAGRALRCAARTPRRERLTQRTGCSARADPRRAATDREREHCHAARACRERSRGSGRPAGDRQARQGGAPAGDG